ncbi:hypothetical protein HGA92_00950 [Candidatus Gracilibacteria bacterium]|nr:hypothetical protein [Candidatus Gracilibacteria bacterium]NUJ98822.1 hypothetical protein [Candidatus Gracilibacteria bacterium]
MEYRNRAKNRRLKRNVLSLANILKFKGLNLSNGEKISVVGIFLSLISLFFIWVDSASGEEKGTAFSSLAGSVGYIMLIVLLFLIFILFSHSRKEKLKLYSDIHFKDSTIIILGGIFNIFLSFNIFSFVTGLQRFSSTIICGNGVILSITGAIVIVIGGIITRKEKKSEKYSIYTNELIEEEEQKEEENNMKLPF